MRRKEMLRKVVALVKRVEALMDAAVEANYSSEEHGYIVDAYSALGRAENSLRYKDAPNE